MKVVRPEMDAKRYVSLSLETEIVATNSTMWGNIRHHNQLY